MKRKLFLRFAGLGDAVFVNTIAYYYWQQTGRKSWVASNHPHIFRGNPGVWALPSSSPKWLIRAGIIMRKVGLVDGLTFLGYQPGGSGEKMKPLQRHILAVLAEKVGLEKVPEKPLMFLSPTELEAGRLPDGGKPWVAMHSTGPTEMTDNKNWYPERFREVAVGLRGEARVVQLGVPGDPDLPCDLDLRGNIPPRAAAAVIASCQAVVCQEGYLMHAAACVGTPAVVIFGGFIAPWESGYPWNMNLFTELPCSPCWLKGPCPYEKKCMQAIDVGAVLAGVQRMLSESSRAA